MALPVEKVEVGFDTSFSGAGNFFTLDDPTKGQLNNTGFPLGGLQFIDVTSRVKRFTISRGRSSLFTNFPAGQLNVEFNNHDRAFDPLYAQSPFVGNIVPRREIRVTTADQVQYSGWIDDWSFSYLPNGDSIAEALAYDATSIIAGQTIGSATPTAQKTGARINYVLDTINWPVGSRNVDAGLANLGTQTIDVDTNAISYLQSVAASEPGLVFIDKTGSLTFLDRTTTPNSEGFVLFGGTGIPFTMVGVSYGSDNLFNEITVARKSGGTALITDPQSITDYGARALTAPEVLLANDADLVDLGLALIQQFSTPEYRFSNLEVALHKLDLAEQLEVLSLDLGSIAKVEFTPNGIGDPIERFVQVISINHVVTTQTHFVEFSFQSVENAYLVLDDAEFGKLNSYSLSW